jgi:hypothetical protein
MRQISIGIQSSKGAVCFDRFCIDVQQESPIPKPTWRYSKTEPVSLIEAMPPRDRLKLRFGSFQLLYDRESPPDNNASALLLVLPSWLSLIFAIPPLLWLHRRKREHARGFEVTTPATAPNRATAD